MSTTSNYISFLNLLEITAPDGVNIEVKGAGGGNIGNVSVNGDGYISGDFTVNGKLTVNGIIDPTGLVLNEQALSPNTNDPDEGSVWVRDDGYLIYTDQTNTDYTIGGPGIGGGTVEDLATTLSAGNITDGTDIELSDNDIITAESITGTLRLRTKDNGAGVSGEIALHSGSANDSGDINIFTGSSTGTAGNINIDTGDSTSSGNSGNMTISTGNAVSGDSGGMTVRTGGGGGAGGGGTLQLTAGNGGNTGTGGDVLINAGSAGTSGSQNGGDITISPGNATSGNGGNLVLSGSSSSSGTDGNIQISTFDARITLATGSSSGGTIELGDAGTLTSGIRLASNEKIYFDGPSGDVTLTTLDLSAGSTATDGLIIKSGNQTSTGSSGDVTVQSGTASSGTSKTGDVDILTPPAGSGSLGSGNISLTTGDGNAGGSGNVTVTTGPGQGSEPGDIIFTTGLGGGGDGIGGDFTVTTGDGSSNNDGGNLQLTTGNGGTGSGVGGTLQLTAGNGGSTGVGGTISITSGAGGSTSGDAGTVDIIGANATSGVGGNINLTPGTGTTDGTVFVNGDGYVFGDLGISGKLTVDGLIDPTGLVLNVQNSNPTIPSLNNGTIWIQSAESIDDGYTTVTSSPLIFTGEESNVYESMSRETYHRGDTPIFASKKIYFHVDGADGEDQVFTMPDSINGVSASTLSSLNPAGCLIVTFDLVYTWSTGSAQAQVNSGTALFEEQSGSWVFIEMITSEATTVLTASSPGGVPTFTLNASGFSGTETVRYMMDVEMKIMGVA